jgi:hypothetical protein
MESVSALRTAYILVVDVVIHKKAVADDPDSSV